jgi:Ca-activated chloride channel homolog
MRRLFALMLTLALPTPSAQAQSATPSTPSFEAGVDIIRLNVSVSARDGFVIGLKPEEFQIFEDGIPQDLAQFVHERLPISLTLLIDCSASMQGKLPLARAAAVQFVRTLREDDQAQVSQFNERNLRLEEFTSDKGRLETAIARSEAGGATALHNAMYVALKELSGRRKPGDLRRQAIVLLSDGEDTSSLVTDEQVIELARQTEIAIYAVSLRSTPPPGGDGRTFSQATYLLTTLARESGGQVYFPSSPSELDRVYGQIAEELRTQYSLGYISSNNKRDGAWRRIVVRIPARGGVQIRHKIGYFAPKR